MYFYKVKENGEKNVFTFWKINMSEFGDWILYFSFYLIKFIEEMFVAGLPRKAKYDLEHLHMNICM